MSAIAASDSQGASSSRRRMIEGRGGAVIIRRARPLSGSYDPFHKRMFEVFQSIFRSDQETSDARLEGVVVPLIGVVVVDGPIAVAAPERSIVLVQIVDRAVGM